jgi:hypothetical protein
MKTSGIIFVIAIALHFTFFKSCFGNVGINNDSSNLYPSVIMNSNSTSKEALIHTLSSKEMDANFSSSSDNFNSNNENFNTHCYKKNFFHIMAIGSITLRYYIGTLNNRRLFLKVFGAKSEYTNLELLCKGHTFLDNFSFYKYIMLENEIQNISLFDLSGFWEDDAGGKYQIRQVGNTVAWYNDRKPVVLNVFVGSIGDNNVLSGNWYDIPGGQAMNSGSISFRIESNDKLVKINSSVYYLGSVITRKGGSLSSICDMNGTWRHYIQGIGESTLTFSSLGNGRYSVRESGLGNASGTAYVNGTRVRLDWTSSQSGDGGYTEWDMSNGCNLGTGNLTYTYGKSGTFTNRIERIGNISSTSSNNCDMNGTWRHYIQGIGESTLTFSSLGNGRYNVRESGLGNASGTAYVNGTRVRLDWTSSQSGDGGYTEWDMSNGCNLGTGNLTYTYGKSGTFTNRIERIGNSNEIGGGICSNPKTQQIMDDWLLLAVPPQGPKDRLRYEEWGRLVGETPTNTLRVSGPPDTRLTRCEYLWEQSNKLESTNGMGSLKDYILKRIQ